MKRFTVLMGFKWVSLASQAALFRFDLQKQYLIALLIILNVGIWE